MELKPFGDVPQKLSLPLKRSFVAARVYSQSLNIVGEIVANLINVSILFIFLSGKYNISVKYPRNYRFIDDKIYEIFTAYYYLFVSMRFQRSAADGKTIIANLRGHCDALGDESLTFFQRWKFFKFNSFISKLGIEDIWV
jgi:hypothetical protein